MKKAYENWRLIQNNCSSGRNCCRNCCQCQAIIIIVYCLTHLFFPFSSFCVHPGKHSLSKGFKGTWKTINWHRNVQEDASINSWTVGIQVLDSGFVLLLNTELLNTLHLNDILSLYYKNRCCVKGALFMCSHWLRPRIWFMGIIKWVNAW